MAVALRDIAHVALLQRLLPPAALRADTLAYKETKKNGEFVLPGFGKAGKAEEDQDSSQDRRQIPSRQGGDGRGSRG